MQRLTSILFQMDEALRHIGDGRIERLRLAMLLLDNAAELQIDRRVPRSNSSFSFMTSVLLDSFFDEEQHYD